MMLVFPKVLFSVLILIVTELGFAELSLGKMKASIAHCPNLQESTLTFPEGFKLGASTSAYQIEGAWNISGKGQSIWDDFVHSDRSAVLNHDNGDITCDSYHKYQEDVAILKKIGFDTYRFSISWTRILPTGLMDNINQDGLNYYKKLLCELEANSIEPFVTMWHWDHPQVLEELGGWTNELMVEWFADYSRILFRELGPWVKNWVTLNEPEILCQMGYSDGIYAPGKHIHGTAEYICAHNALKAHATVYGIYQDEFKSEQKGIVGVVTNPSNYKPKDPDVPSTAEIAFEFSNNWFLHPIFSQAGDYPKVMKDVIARNSKKQGFVRSRLPVFSQRWLQKIRGSADFLGINYYTTYLTEYGESGEEPSFERDRGLILSKDPAWKTSASSWLTVNPKGFGQVLRKIVHDYGNPPIYVTENGVSDFGGTDDTARIQYFHDYIKEMLLTMECEGANIKGYFIWSLLDTFEWDRSYSEKFGIVDVDFKDPQRKRTLKDSAYWWMRVLRSRKLESVSAEHQISN